MTMARRRLWAAVVVCALAACGGGGGGGDSSSGGGGGGGGGSTGAPGSAADLIPAAPALGATLAADAATLRPIRDGAVWSYRGVRRLGATATPQSYVTTTRQVSTTAGQAQEIASNPGGEGSSDTQPLNIAGGTVGHTEQIDFAGKGVLETVSVVELRSPVREGDQYTMHSRRYTDTAFDTDGDQKPDTLDVAVYARVVGAETLTLENLPPLKTVRVDTVLRTRLTPSRSNVPAPVYEVNIQTWYAAGIGVVRQMATAPLPNGSDYEVSDETLTTWDGITEGAGVMAAETAVIPASDAEFPSRRVPGLVYAAATLPDGALLMTPLPGSDSNGMGVLAVRLDRRGRVVEARAHRTLRPQASVMVGHAGGVLHLVTPAFVGWGPPTLQLTRFAADGSLIGAIGDRQIDLSGGRVNATIPGAPVAAVDGQDLWILWQRWVPTPLGVDIELVLRAYALDGTPRGPELRLAPNGAADLSLSAAGGKALVSWIQMIPNSPGAYALVPSGATTASVQTLLASFSAAADGPTALRSSNHSLLLWPTPLGNFPPDGGAGGVRLDAADQPLLPAGGALAGAQLQQVNRVSLRHALTQGDRLFFVGLNGVVCFEIGSGPLASSAAYRVGLSLDSIPSTAVAFDDRVLLLGGFGDLNTQVVWLAPR